MDKPSSASRTHIPKFGLQGPVVAWHDAWAGAMSDEIMRTGTGAVVPSQDPTPDPDSFVRLLKELGADYYVHHMFPGLAGHSAMIADMVKHGLDVCLGNEYGNINGPYVEGTNRYDVPDDTIVEAASSGRLMGLLYDEPEHLQINAGQYRKGTFLPHWGSTDGLSLAHARAKVTQAIADRAAHVAQLLEREKLPPKQAPLVSEHVFPVMFHTAAHGGMAVCPKVMKESFQSLQLSTALGAARQYERDLWICADLWGPDIGQWFIRTSGLPGHSPQEYASALRMAYYMSPSHLFTENIDALARFDGTGFRKTEFGEVWDRFIREFVPAHPLAWGHREANPDIAIIHSDDSNYGQNERLYGNRRPAGAEHSTSIFHVWHLLSHGTIPAHGSCMHIPGYASPRAILKREVQAGQYPLPDGWNPDRIDPIHPLFYPVNNAVVYDEFVTDRRLGNPQLILAAGSDISADTLVAIRSRAEQGATVIIGDWLAPDEWSQTARTGDGKWIVTGSFLDDARVMEHALPYLGSKDVWTQRFGNHEVRMTKADAGGFELDFEIVRREG